MVTVPVGATVTWTNRDPAAHTVTADAGAFDSGTLEPGQSYTLNATLAGRYTYLCTIHPEMRGLLVVERTTGGTATPTPVTTATAAPSATPAATGSAVPTATATSSPTPIATAPTGTPTAVYNTSSVTPNGGGWSSGTNAAVVEGGASVQQVVAAAMAGSGRNVVSVWQLTSGRWTFYLPSHPTLAGGLTSIPGPVGTVLVVLS
jgi:hypothetical protein